MKVEIFFPFSAAEQLVLLYFSLLLDKTYSVETLENWFIFPKKVENTLPLREILANIKEKGWINQHEITTEKGTFLAYSCERFVREAIFGVCETQCRTMLCIFAGYPKRRKCR